jgi:hypothetical protein
MMMRHSNDPSSKILEQNSNRADKRSCAKNTKILKQNSTDLINGNDFSCVKESTTARCYKTTEATVKRTGKHSTTYILGKAKEKQIINGNGKPDTRFQVLTVQYHKRGRRL